MPAPGTLNVVNLGMLLGGCAGIPTAISRHRQNTAVKVVIALFISIRPSNVTDYRSDHLGRGRAAIPACHLVVLVPEFITSPAPLNRPLELPEDGRNQTLRLPKAPASGNFAATQALQPPRETDQC